MKINNLSELDKEIRLLRIIHLLNHTYNLNTEYVLDFDLITENNPDIDVINNNTFFIKNSSNFDIRLNLNFDHELNNQTVIIFAVSSIDNINYDIVPYSLREFNFDKKSGTYIKFYIKSLLNDVSLVTLTENTTFGEVTLPNIVLNMRSLSI